jgi:DNA helicase-2/ATP-dependent DNA helicase PcrA
MKISHDTLLEYGLIIVEKYDTLKQIVIDKYPFVFIDEYQDTNEKIVLIMSTLENYAKKIVHKFFIGYFGDTAQNIYDDGVGSKINDIHIGLKPINKEFNRRSTKEVISVINVIRNDNLKQVSIYDDCGGGSIKFYKGAPENVKDFINKYVLEWEISSENKLHCLVLTNKVVAEYSGFKNIYEAFKETDKYKGINYNQLNTELLSNDLSKLGEIPKLLFNIIKLHNNLVDNKTPVIEILPKKSLLDDMNIEDLRKLINILKQNKGKTLGEYVTSISACYTSVNNEIYEKVMDWTFNFKITSCEIFNNFLLEKLFNDITDDNNDYAKEIIQKLLEIEMDEYELWYKFIIDKQVDKIIYHTYHGTKGLEFDNVIIIMENAFGKNRDYFSFFFKNFSEPAMLEGDEKQLYEKVKNLLYVSCSRAVKNLRVLYIDDISNFESGIEEIFGQICSYNIK